MRFRHSFLILGACFLCWSVSAQTDSQRVPPPPPEYEIICKGSGKLFIYGTVRNSNKTGKAVRIELIGNNIESTTSQSDGRYCFRYEYEGKDFNALNFFANPNGGAKVSFSLIAGDRSHIINKIIPDHLASIQTNATPLDHGVSQDLYSLGNGFISARVNIVNSSDKSVMIQASGFDGRPPNVSGNAPDLSQPAAPIVFPSLDPALVAQVVARRGGGFSLFRIGSFSIFNVSRSSRAAHAVASIHQDGLKPNEIVPAHQAITRTVFVSRSLLSLSESEAKNPQAVVKALGTFRVTAVRVDDGEILTSELRWLRDEKLKHVFGRTLSETPPLQGRSPYSAQPRGVALNSSPEYEAAGCYSSERIRELSQRGLVHQELKRCIHSFH